MAPCWSAPCRLLKSSHSTPPQTVTDGEWDGCVWMERLESISPDSLAAQLYQETVDTGAVVKRWLERFI